ncbi:hypothetical protein LO762_22840 [Actinocorallia sp. API 0066]|uniref:hypothetical protein n=1 Tax=Actinocorallia sp. API 0066 TaxID=2896846 RepID=UPI001E526340|nr:hypothetical protein [Actinocorallia sp. API 0066]MCD0452007.1 hypothetical protein [Actinocorallia sp. API 0066]
MQAISVKQPYAWAVARGHRRLSNQDEPTPYRGTVLIHAAMRVDLDSRALPQVLAAGWDPADPLSTLGAVIAVATVTDVCEAGVSGPCACGPWAKRGDHHWLLDDIRPLRRPIVAVGYQGGLWTAQPSLVAEVRSMLPEPPQSRERLLIP